MLTSDFLLHKAAQNGDVAFINEFANNPYPVDEVNDRGWTPLVLAVYSGHIDTINALLLHGANINYQNPNGTSILMYAKTNLLFTKNYALLDYLIERGANIYLRDKVNNWTVLDYIKEKGDMDMFVYLLKYVQ